MGGWAPPLRIARRTARRSLGRTALVSALIGLPVLAATWLGVIAATASPQGETLARIEIGQADAGLAVTPYARLDTLNPPVLGTVPAPANGAENPIREPEKVDPLPLLPPGTTLARQLHEVGSIDIRGQFAITSVGLVVGDGASPLAEDTVKLYSGKMPTGKDEVAVSPALADRLGLRTGDELRPDAILTAADGEQFRVVGLARPIIALGDGVVFAPPGTPLYQADSAAHARYLLDLPDSVDAASLIGPLAAQGLWLLPRANIVDPPPDPYGMSAQDAGPYAVMALVVGFGLLEVVLLAGTAFAVGARRQTRDLGLVLAAGGTPRDVRRIVLLQGAAAGVVGVTTGLVLAGILLVAGKPLWEKVSNTVFIAWQVPWGGLAAIVLLGLLSGLAAAVVPAVAASRQTPMAALAGRFAATHAKVRIRKLAVVLLVAGIGSVLVGNVGLANALAEAQRTPSDPHGYQATATPTGPIALVLLGITVVVAALVWMLPSLVALTAGPARRFPLSTRLALRDAARHRHRTGPATAAIMMAVAATAAAAFATSNSMAADAKNYMPETKHGHAVVDFQGGWGRVSYSASAERQVASALPVENTYRLGQVVPPGAQTRNGYTPPVVVGTTEPVNGMVGLGLLVVDPAFLVGLGDFGTKAAEHLRAGRIVVPGPGAMDAAGTVRLEKDAGGSAEARAPETKPVARHPAAYAGETPRMLYLKDHALISPEAAAKYGKVMTTRVSYELTREPTDDELAAVSRILGRDDLLVVEQGYQSPARLYLLSIVGAATIVTLLGVAISVSLSAAEGRADLATLAAIGAQPRRRRGLAAAQAWVLGQLGCLLGVGVGALYGYTAHVAFGSPEFAIPWPEIVAILVVVPLFAGALAWLLTRSRLPMVSRIE